MPQAQSPEMDKEELKRVFEEDGGVDSLNESQTKPRGEGCDLRAATFGEEAVGLTFNPGGDEDVNQIKIDYAKIIDMLNNKREALKNTEASSPMDAKVMAEKGRLLSVAITEAQAAQMWAVKAITWKM